ncbi:MAG: hypothetical protein ACOCZB_09065 [Spirochaetota bacterium]
MKTRTIIGLLSVVVLLGACATVEPVRAPEAASPSGLSTDEAETQPLELETHVEGELEESDALVRLGAEDVSIDVYNVTIPDEGAYVVEIKSLGNMFGFDKTIMMPDVEVRDANGADRDGEYLAYERVEPGLVDPLSILLRREYYLDEGTYQVIVYSDVNAPDQIYVTSAFNLLFIPIGHVYADTVPHGKYRIRVSASQD